MRTLRTFFSDLGDDRFRNLLGAGLIILCLGVYAFVIIGSIDKPFATDEIYYAGWAHGISETGAPVYYSGEDDGLHPRLVEPISHPTLHFNLLGVMFIVFGVQYWSLRLLGVFLFVGMMAFLRFVVYKEKTFSNERLLFVGLLLIFNPLFMQQSMVLAIEAQAFWFPMLVFLWAFYRESTGYTLFRYFPYFFTTLMLVVLLWLKETNVPIYFIVCTSYLLMIKQFKKIPIFWMSVAAAMGLFWGTWVLYCQITDVDVYSWWDFTVRKKMATGSGGLHRIIEKRGWARGLSTVWSSLRVSISWISVPYLILFVSAAVIRIKNIMTKKEAKLGFYELCLLYALVLFGITKIARPTTAFIKYENPGHLLMGIFVMDVFFSRIRKKVPTLFMVTLVGVLVGIGLFEFVPDRILRIRHTFNAHILWSVGLVGVSGVVLWLKKRDVMYAMVFGLLFGIVALNMNLFVHQSMNDYTTGQSWGNYGENLVDTTAWLKKHLKNGEGLAAFKDIQFNMRIMEGKDKSPTWEARLFTKHTERKLRKQKERLLNSGKIRYIVLNRYAKSPKGIRYLKKNNYRQVEKINGHLVFERKQCPYCKEKKGEVVAGKEEK